MLVRREWMIVTLLLTAPIPAAAGNVITEWNEKAVGIVQPAAGPLPPLAVRNIAIGRRQDPRVAGERWRVGRRRLPAEDQAGGLYADTDHLRLAVGDHDTLRLGELLAIPSEATASARLPKIPSSRSRMAKTRVRLRVTSCRENAVYPMSFTAASSAGIPEG